MCQKISIHTSHQSDRQFPRTSFPKGITSLSDQIAINKAKQNFQSIVSQAEDKGVAPIDTKAVENAIAAARYRDQAAKSPGHPANQGGGQGGVSTAGQAIGTSRSAPQDAQGSWYPGAKEGGLIRKKYGNGGIVDLL